MPPGGDVTDDIAELADTERRLFLARKNDLNTRLSSLDRLAALRTNSRRWKRSAPPLTKNFGSLRRMWTLPKFVGTGTRIAIPQQRNPAQ